MHRNKKVITGIVLGSMSVLSGAIALPKMISTVQAKKKAKREEKAYSLAKEEYRKLVEHCERLEKLHSDAFLQFKGLDLTDASDEDILVVNTLVDFINATASTHEELKEKITTLCDIWSFEPHGVSLGYLIDIEA